MSTITLPEGVQITAEVTPEMAEILTPDALAFVAKLQRAFEPRRQELLAKRVERQARARRRRAARLPARDAGDPRRRLDGGARPRPTSRTAASRSPARSTARWSSTRSTAGANVFMADFEDSNTPTWDNMIAGPDQPARRRAPARSPSPIRDGKDYALNDKTADAARAPARLAPAREARAGRRRADVRLALRLRPLLLPQREGAARRAAAGPYFYLPKMESHLEARLWNDVFVIAQDELGVPQRHDQGDGADRDASSPRSRWTRSSTSCATTRPGLNCGRWDYIFSFIKKFRNTPDFVLPDRAQVTMTTHFMRSYAQLADQDLPPARRPRDGRHGGADPDQERPGGQRGGAGEGARRQGARGRRRPRRHLGRAPRPGADRQGEAFDARDAGPEPDRPQARGRARHGRRTCSTFVPEGTITEAGLRLNINVGIQYLERLAARQRLRADLQPDGGRRHRRDLALAGLAVDPQRRRACSTTAARSTPSCSARCSPRSSRRSASSTRRACTRSSTGPPCCSTTSRTSDDFVDFLTLPAYDDDRLSRRRPPPGRDGRGRDRPGRMRLMLLRHGIAEDAGPGDRLPRRAARADPRGAGPHGGAGPRDRRSDIEAAVVLTSPLVRCRQTAEIVAAALGLTPVEDDRPAPRHGAGRSRGGAHCVTPAPTRCWSAATSPTSRRPSAS